jgi:hypothetical protein|tara:strand:- start:474 stop:755 length:282 start_codon:yes stop_codon:yes gene_type:complete
MIKIIQLNSGEMLIAKLNDDNNEMENPLFVHQQAVEGQGPKVNLYPYNILGQGNITLNPDNIVWTVDPEQKLLNQYETAFSSIITPPKNKIVT